MGHGRPTKAADGTLVYPQRGWEPPPVPAGYQRKNNNLKSADAWTMIPILTPCKYRTTVMNTGYCGAQTIKYFCKGRRLYDLSTCHRCSM